MGAFAVHGRYGPVAATRCRQTDHYEQQASRDPAFITALTAGGLSWKAYADLLAQQFFVYESLEQAAQEMAGDALAGAFILPTLSRSAALGADLRFLRGAGWLAQISALSSTTVYCIRLRDTAFHSASRFAAHYATRHLDDLMAALPLGRAAAAAYGLDGPGRQFYTYDESRAADLRRRYGTLIEGDIHHSAHESGFLAEMSYARDLHAAVLDELGQKWA